jgi:octanoyl-[GcvH]:protein N-octanoyltransferase/lipoyl amidotransferase
VFVLGKYNQLDGGKNWQEIILGAAFRYIDHTNIDYFHQQPYTALTSFAIDDALSLSVSDALSPPAMRLWVHPDTIVLGIPDARLPYIEDGVKLLSEQGYHVIIRNSGGLAVALDEGVLNISLVLPGVKHLSIHDCYEAMASFIRFVLRDLTDQIEAYEIIGSYCPGDYDLSINGKKFAGISQRRVKDGAAVQIYLDVEGNSHRRASLIRDFYQISRQGEETKFTYPEVDPAVMGSLSGLLNKKITVDEMKLRVHHALGEQSGTLETMPFSEQEIRLFERRYGQMIRRNEEVTAWQ